MPALLVGRCGALAPARRRHPRRRGGLRQLVGRRRAVGRARRHPDRHRRHRRQRRVAVRRRRDCAGDGQMKLELADARLVRARRRVAHELPSSETCCFMAADSPSCSRSSIVRRAFSAAREFSPENGARRDSALTSPPLSGGVSTANARASQKMPPQPHRRPSGRSPQQVPHVPTTSKAEASILRRRDRGFAQIGTAAQGTHELCEVEDWTQAFSEEWDAVVLGTGMKECLLSGLLAGGEACAAPRPQRLLRRRRRRRSRHPPALREVRGRREAGEGRWAACATTTST